MAAVIGFPLDKLEELIKPFQHGRNICVIANDNSSTQVVISGTLKAVSEVADQVMEAGGKKVIKLKTSGPFHSPLMANAAIELDSVISDFADSIMDAKIPVVMNVTARPLEGKDQVNPLLVQQITDRVRWRELIAFMIHSGVDRIVEIGPGKVLAKLSKREYPDLDIFGIETISDVEAIGDI